MPDINPNLLSGIEALKNPDYNALNANRGRNDRLLHAVLCAYAKVALNCVYWEKFEEILQDAIGDEIGYDELERWTYRIKDECRRIIL